MDFRDLEHDIDRRLKRLPTPRAPRSLAPRVMAALGETSRTPWYARGWAAWPRRWQAASVVSLAMMLAALAWGAPHAMSAFGPSPTTLLAMPQSVIDALRTLEVGLEIGRVLYRTTLQPLLGYVAVFILAMTVACVAFGAALDRVALGGASEI